MRHVLKSSTSFLTLAMLLTACAARAAIPGADDPKAYTYHDFCKARLDYNQRTLTQAYKTFGKHDPKWDDAATQFLDSVCLYFAYHSDPAVYRPAHLPTTDQCLALAKAASDAGCDDPLVIYCTGAIFCDLEQYRYGAAMVEKSVDGLVARKYPDVRISAAAERAFKLPSTRADAAKAAKYQKIARDHALAALSAKIDDKDLRVLVSMEIGFFLDLPIQQRIDFCKALEANKQTNPWIVELLYGKYEIDAAWDARGSGWANTVDAAGWDLFFGHLLEAKRHLVKAHELHPEFPEAACYMISVAMGGENRVNEKTRDWFDKSVKAQLDYIPAYSAYVWSIYPRWGGSHREMFQLGLECLQTNRYDTNVPYQLMTILDSINADSNNDFTIFTVPQVQAAVRQVMSNMIEKTKDERTKYWYASYQTALAWRTGQYAEAAQLLDKYSDHIDQSAFTALKTWAPYAISEIRAMTSSQSSTLAAAAKAAQADDNDTAITQLREASSKLAKDDPAQFFIQYRARMLENQRDFLAGKPVSLTPDEFFAPWQVISGDWKKEKDGSFVATTDKTGRALLLCRNDFGPAYELQAKLDTGDAASAADAGLAFNWRDDRTGFFAVFEPASGNVVSNSFTGLMRQPLKIAPGDTISVQVVGSQYNVLVNGKPMLSQPVQSKLRDDLHVGLVILQSKPGSVVKFKDVQIQRAPAPGK